jgi:tetratricopeptide (TPR) repeat protein
MQWWSAHTELEAHLNTARRTLGDDPVLLLQEGALHQVFAHPRAQAAFEAAARQGGRRRGLTPGQGAMLPVRRSIASERVDAERAFRDALRLEPALHEARIRLAHVIHDRGRFDDALDELDRVSVTTLTPMLRFYFHLVRGRAERALDRLDAARLSFESAHAIVPNAQTPRLALSEVTLALGDHVAAREHLAALSEGTASVEDPWPVLGRTHDGADEMMRQMWVGF